MGAMSKAKGSRGEREVCKILGDCFGLSFIRSANSGAFVGGVNAARKAHLAEGQVRGLKGDIFPPDELPRMVIETKLYKEFPYHQFLTGKPVALLDEWIGQCLETNDDGDFWFICFRADRRDWSICVPAEHRANIKLGTHINYIGEDGEFIVTNLEEFLANNADYMREASQS